MGSPPPTREPLWERPGFLAAALVFAVVLVVAAVVLAVPRT